MKPSNVAYKHPSLVPRENDVREHKLFVGKCVTKGHLCIQGLDKGPSGCPGQVDSPSGQVIFHSRMPGGQGSGMSSAKKIIEKNNLAQGCMTCRAQEKFKGHLSHGLAGIQGFSNRGIPVVISYFAITFCKLICTLHFSFFFISHFFLSEFFFSFRQEIRSSCFADLRCGNTISHIDHQGRCIFICFRVNFEDLVIDQSITVPVFILHFQNISSSDEGGYTYLRINLFCPGR